MSTKKRWIYSSYLIGAGYDGRPVQKNKNKKFCFLTYIKISWWKKRCDKIKHWCGVSCAVPSDQIAKTPVRTSDTGTACRPYVCDNGASARQNGRTSSRNPSRRTDKVSRPCASSNGLSNATTWCRSWRNRRESRRELTASYGPTFSYSDLDRWQIYLRPFDPTLSTHSTSMLDVGSDCCCCNYYYYYYCCCCWNCKYSALIPGNQPNLEMMVEW